MSPVVLGLGLFGGLFGGHDGNCRQGVEQAARTMQRIERQWPLRSPVDPVVVYLQRLGERLASVDAGGRRGSWRFHVLRNLEPTAFAAGGGNIVVSDGLIALVRGEDELAAVLAHEIAHQQLGHFCRASSDAGRRIRLGSVVQHFDLDFEIDADAAAVRRLALAGYDPGAMRGVLTCLTHRRPRSSNSGLNARLDALDGVLGSRSGAQVRSAPGFERVRRLVLEDVGGGVKRCR
ncbi:M48 family metallopeptidase [Thioflavicoccus mobilis]|uniref:M48 family metallopeptidase n=1 Tax=Thioflavicoccus mobilis TaxID=80679 RepID=UPI0002EB01FC|nr:M48 family metallopeptidase [Thioflavicoccus mobilis]